MSDDEIEANNEKLVHYFTGVTTALTVVIQALQAQSGYDHQKFLTYLATYQVVGEQMEGSVPSVRDKSYQDTLALFAKTPPQVGSVAQRL
jgi:hypothetical protein